MKRVLLSITLLLAIKLIGLSQTHFTPVWTGNGLDHMNIYVTSATIDGIPLQPGDEIGVFDDSYCVGAVLRGTLLTPYLEIRVSKDDPLTPGVVDGYQVDSLQYFRIWDFSEGVEYQFPFVQVTSGDVNFTVGGTTMVMLEVKTNKPPVADAGASLVVNEGDLVKIIGTSSSDPDGNPLTYTWSVTPTIGGLDLTNDTLIFNAPEVTTNTLYNFELVVNDGTINSDGDFTSLYVKNVNKVPIITGQSAVNVDEDTPLTITLAMITVVDPDPLQTITLKVQPGNYLINNNTITPLPDFNGALTVPIKVNDGIVNSEIFELLVTVNAINDLPKFTSSPSISTLQGQPYIYSLTAEDIDGDVLTYSGTALPAWLTLANDGANKGTLSGTPAIGDVGNHNITITLTDGTANITQSFVLTVKPVTNAPELVTTELPVAYIGSAYTGQLTFFDFDSDSVFVSLQNQPSWLSLEGNVNGIAKLELSGQSITVNLIGTPTATSLGTFGINILFDDKTNKRSKILPIKVLVANTKPVAQDISFSTYEDEPVLIALKGIDNETPYGLVYHVVEPLKHGEIVMVGPRLFLYYPELNYFGKDSLEYSVFEQGLSALGDTAKVVITIDPVNDQPVITALQTKFTFNEGQTVTVSDVDYNDDVDGIYADGLQVITLFGPFSGSFNTTTFEYTPNTGFFGQDVVFLNAKENTAGGLESDPLMLRFDIARVNKPPFVSVNAVKLDEDTPISFIPLVYDREDDISNLQIELTDTSANGVITKNGILLTFTPNQDWNGTDSISFKVMDSNGELSSELEVYLYCTAVNDYPVANPQPVDASGASSVNLDFSTLVTDVDNTLNDLSIEFLLTNESDSASGIFASEINTGATPMLFTYNSQHTNGVDYIPYRVFDGKNTSTPSLISITNLATTKSASIKATDTLIARGDYIDITWGDTIDLIFTTLTTGSLTEAPVLEIVNSNDLNGTLSTPQVLFFSAGNPLITYRATYTAPPKFSKKARGNDTAVLFDKVGFKTRKGQKASGDSSNVDTMFVGNLQTPVPVILAPVENQNVDENQTATVDVYFTDPDTRHEKIVFEADSSVAGTTYSFNLLAEGHQVLTINPPADFFGNLIMNVKAIDTTSVTTETQFMINVAQVNQAPEITVVDSIFFMKNTQRNIFAIISDRETEKSLLTITLTATPSGAVSQLLEQDGDITVVPSTDYAQDFLLNIEVKDEAQLTTTKQVKMQYKSTNSMPSLEPVNSLVAYEDTPVELDITPTDPDVDDPIEVTVESSNASIFETTDVTVSPISSTTGTLRTLTFTPKSNESGISDITLFANDGFKSAAQEFSIEVKPMNDDPVLSNIVNQTMKNNATLTVSLGATDIDSYIFTFDATSTNADLDIDVVDNVLTISILNSYFGTTSFTVTVADDSLDTNSQTVQLVVEDASAIPTSDLKEISVYPNPVNSEFYVNWKEGTSGKSDIFIFNAQGQLVHNVKVELVQNVPNRVDVSNLPQGMYLIKLQTNESSYFTRIIKK